MSSEMVLSDLLTKEHGIISKNWFYSTELRFLNNQLVFEFFLFFGHNYHITRVLSGIVLMAIMITGYHYMLKQMGLKEYFLITAPILMLPFSYIYSDIVLLGLYYIPHISISFFSMGLVFAVENANDEKLKKRRLITLLILSLLAGIGGPRQIIIFYLPLLLTALIRFYVTKKFTFKSIYWAFVAAAIGYIINSKILIKFYKYNGWAGFTYTEFNSEKLDMILQGFLNVLGFTKGEIFSFATVRTGTAFVLILLAFAYYIYFFKHKAELKNEEVITASFLLTASFIYIIIYLFTDMFYEDRYTLPFIVFLLPLFAFTIKNHNWNSIAKNLFTCFLCLLILADSILVYKASWFEDKTREHRQITQFLLENNYLNGYSSYWNANLFTELANGKIDSYVWTSATEEINDVDDLYRWLQVKSHKENKPTGRVFIVLDTTEYNYSPLKRFLDQSNLVFATNNYFVFGFESYESMISVLSSYAFNLSDNTYIGTAENTDAGWVINNGQNTVGPFITLYEGKYSITVHGQNLTNANVRFEYSLNENEGINILDPSSVALYGDSTDPEAILNSVDPITNEEITDSTIADNNEIEPSILTTELSDGTINYQLTINKNLHDFQILIFNNNESPVIIQDISIIRK